MRLGQLLKSLVTLSNAVAATTGSLRQDGAKVPPALQKVEEKAAILAQAGAMLDEQSGALRDLDAFFDRAALVNATVQLRMLADDGSELEPPIILSPLLVDAVDALLDRLEGK